MQVGTNSPRVYEGSSKIGPIWEGFRIAHCDVVILRARSLFKTKELLVANA